MSRRIAAALLAALLLALGLSSAAQAASPKIVALTPFTANTISLLGIKPIAIGETLGGNEKFNRGLKGVDRLTLAHPNGANPEELAVKQPDLVLSAPIWRKGNDRLKSLGIKVVESDPQSVDDVMRQTESIGQLVGKRAAAKRLADTQRARLKVAKSRARRHPTVLLVLGLGRSVQAFMPNSWGGDVITQSGGRLLTKGLESATEQGFAKLSDEVIIQRNPDIIIAVPHGPVSNIPRIAEDLRNNAAWKNTKAAKTRRIFVSTDNSLLQAMPQAASVIAAVQTKYLRNR
ncbi:ABC transporter substrate-binding protein [Conexibacter sp. JD483]|uniref:ABC transporter substrate-binding protein n=1 Tax=unclassified Conexibacter TaxID=2627773 RepID=UPI0027287790|nr:MULTISPECIES: ABC transporter substrate-binding protein [unclassified Conexibacter]MDO8185429.1 ABC transporter substrate-binding protein [Conexibacter sp. CPCC 205706]MDO8198395.1 ABC transporter substrate-binding protein [Conexibacter sp. CPCC 205762]MDR9369357.1 ABC transporter substrate-binding protein [Conexibacter sp. JD483]